MYGLNHWWRGPLLFSTVQISHFQVEVAQTICYDATTITPMLALWTGTERTVTLDSWYCLSRNCYWHLIMIISLDGSATLTDLYCKRFGIGSGSPTPVNFNTPSISQSLQTPKFKLDPTCKKRSKFS
jgi:hypothetical protein